MRHTSSIPPDTRGNVPPGAMLWTGEVQSIAVTSTTTAATEITIEGRYFYIYATTECHLLFGNAGIHEAHATALNRCFPIPDCTAVGWIGPIYVPDEFDVNQDGTGKLYVRVIRNSADGRLYLAAAATTDDSLQRGATSTSSSTTTTTTTTTSTSTTTTSTSTTTTSTSTTTTTTSTTTTT